MKKRITVVSSIMLVFSLLLSACSGNANTNSANVNNSEVYGGNNQNTEGQEAETNWTDEDGNGVADWQEKQIELDYAMRFYGENDDTNPMFLNIRKFMEKYPNITVARDSQFAIEQSDTDELEILTARAMEGTLPDIFYSPLAAESYDRELTLDLTSYLDKDPESKWISENAKSFMTTYDGKGIYGIPFQSVSEFPAVNLNLLKENNIAIPPYNWTYADYEHLRSEVAKLTPNNPVFPGGIGFIDHGPHYFDGIPNGWKGFNSETKRFDFANSKKYGMWLDQFAKEDKQGLWFWDLPEDVRKKKVGESTNPWADGLEAVGNFWLYSLSTDVNEMIKTRKMDIDIYPMPTAPEGGITDLHGYYDTLSLSSALDEDPVKAEAAYQLLKWLTYGEEGLKSRWALIDEYMGLPEDAPIRAEDQLMDFIQGWPVTTNPEVLKNHPLVKGFPEDSELAIFNFQAFQNVDFQQMLSNPVPYPRQLPGVVKAYDTLNPWEIRNQIRDKGKKYSDVAAEWDSMMNKTLDDYLGEYNAK
ncbi:ABC transporter substrate-binding protein [Paenibacillus sp. FSL L8-0323]|uniref:ABC transporter substrate-binding protein n=1 Tax=Paenibacillus odorifer TaxID=189426 RepID=A0A1R0Y1B1_9BACL|nr:ABC transporter substrate-binding protein [Paenibacillus odorifer]OMD13009.1 ABC transporter substrate-binding protein [Paenibacillus odorifer]OMD21055.1 ABC transporter substrate-binding protein [Paenibacillus odorifer]OMD41144.1 ABC transporter substrate-binding protein [Paenibacillus odorifer]